MIVLFLGLSFLAMRSPIPSISFGITIAGPGTEKSWQDSTGTSKSLCDSFSTIIHSDEDALCEEDTVRNSRIVPNMTSWYRIISLWWLTSRPECMGV